MNDKPVSIPYIAYESSMSRMERTNKRLWIMCLILIVALLGTNIGWLLYERQWEYYETEITQEVEQDGSGVNIISGGDTSYGADGETDSKD